MPPEDSAWKTILEEYLEQFLLLLFPKIHAIIDWSRPIEWLDKEFEALWPGQNAGPRIVDKLAKVFLKDGTEQWILIHVEVEGGGRKTFNARMFRYHVLIRWKHDQTVLSLGILTDDVKSFRPGLYLERFGDQVLLFRFPTVKLLDFESERAMLESSKNPFAMVVLAHLDARKAHGDRERFDVRFTLTEKVCSPDYEGEDRIKLERFLKWILALPTELEVEFREKVRTEIEGVRTMPYLSTFEEIALEKGKAEGRAEGKAEGKEEGLLEALGLGLELRFGEAGLALLPRVKEIKDLTRLETLVAVLRKSDRIEDFEGRL